jgi:hypothetical protein
MRAPVAAQKPSYFAVIVFILIIPPFDLNKSAHIALSLAFCIQGNNNALGLNMSNICIVTVNDGPSAEFGRDIRLALKYHGRAFIGRIRQTLD